VSVPDPEQTAWQRHRKIEATARDQLLAIHVAAASLRRESRDDQGRRHRWGFADRRYAPDGTLVPRSRPDAFVEDADEAVRQAEWLLREKGVRTLCVHGDNPKALAFVKALRQALERQDFTIRAFALS